MNFLSHKKRIFWICEEILYFVFIILYEKRENMYCNKCGNPVYPNSPVCGTCGTPVSASGGVPPQYGQPPIKQDDPNMLLNLVACCIPLVGIVLYFVWKDEKPRSAKQVCVWALVGFGLSIFIYLVMLFFGFLSAASDPYYYGY
jgi:hypothetical protein